MMTVTMAARVLYLACSLFLILESCSCIDTTVQTIDTVPLPAPDSVITETLYCEFYNETCVQDPSKCPSREECKPHEPDKRNHCFVLWHTDNVTRERVVKLKGCFMDSKQCYNKLDCVDESYRPKKDLMFCCCEGNMCNSRFDWIPASTEPPAVSERAVPNEDDDKMTIIIIITVVFLVLIFVSLSIIIYFRRRNMNFFNELPTVEPSLSCPPSPEGLDDCKHLPIVLKEVRARGRFGAVWRAHLNQREVAVKVFPVQDKQSWLTEQDIYKLPRMNHNDILEYIGVEKRGDNLQAEYMLITAFHEKGSLCDFLKANTITWEEAWQIAFTMARGLTHLHDEIPGIQGGPRKPAIAHRDFKSKNVLLKRDMSACIADFGLALVFQPGKPCGDTHGQVGTRRYMAPEVLEGAINFTRDAFLRIDMYACGLVLWEIASRCTAWGNVGEYMLPFEEEVGAHPSLEEMQDAVVIRKLRPSIPEAWREHNALYVFCDTMEECWDHDAEARLSASCVMERIGALSRLPRHTPTSRAPLLIENAHPLPPHSNRVD